MEPLTPASTPAADPEIWVAVDHYFERLLLPSDPVLEAALADSAAAGLPAISVSRTQGEMLGILAQSVNARRILELGTLGGYSTICLARALPDNGRLITIEFEPLHAEVARRNIARAGFAQCVELRVGRAIDHLTQLVAEACDPFDLIFIDADKENYADYLSWALKLSRHGTLIIADNVVRKGEVIDSNSTDSRVQGIQRFNQALAKESQVKATVVQTVGNKGYDGFILAVVKNTQVTNESPL